MRAKKYMKGSKIGTATIIGGGDPVCTSNLESTACIPSNEGNESKAFDSPVRITVVSYRSILTDVDNTAAKAAIDGLVHCGVLQDDGPKYVTEVRYRQVKVKSKEEEETRLIIEVV